MPLLSYNTKVHFCVHSHLLAPTAAHTCSPYCVEHVTDVNVTCIVSFTTTLQIKIAITARSMTYRSYVMVMLRLAWRSFTYVREHFFYGRQRTDGAVRSFLMFTDHLVSSVLLLSASIV